MSDDARSRLRSLIFHAQLAIGMGRVHVPNGKLSLGLIVADGDKSMVTAQFEAESFLKDIAELCGPEKEITVDEVMSSLLPNKEIEEDIQTSIDNLFEVIDIWHRGGQPDRMRQLMLRMAEKVDEIQLSKAITLLMPLWELQSTAEHKTLYDAVLGRYTREKGEEYAQRALRGFVPKG